MQYIYIYIYIYRMQWIIVNILNYWFCMCTLFQFLSTVHQTCVSWALSVKKQHYDAIHSSRKLETTCCTTWHSNEKFHHENLGVNIKTVQRIWKKLNESNGDYEGATAWKLYSDCSDKKTPEFLDKIQTLIEHDTSKWIRSITRNMKESEFLIRQVVQENIQYFSYKMGKNQFLS